MMSSGELLEYFKKKLPGGTVTATDLDGDFVYNITWKRYSRQLSVEIYDGKDTWYSSASKVSKREVITRDAAFMFYKFHIEPE